MKKGTKNRGGMSLCPRTIPMGYVHILIIISISNEIFFTATQPKLVVQEKL